MISTGETRPEKRDRPATGAGSDPPYCAADERALVAFRLDGLPQLTGSLFARRSGTCLQAVGQSTTVPVLLEHDPAGGKSSTIRCAFYRS